MENKEKRLIIPKGFSAIINIIVVPVSEFHRNVFGGLYKYLMIPLYERLYHERG